MSDKPNCTAKPRHRHCTLKLLVLQHLRYLLWVLVLPQQVQQPHSYNLSHGGLRSYCLSAVHLHHTPMATNTVNVAASGPLFHLYFVPVSLSLCFSVHRQRQSYFLLARLVQFLKCDNANCSEWRTLCFGYFPLSLFPLVFTQRPQRPQSSDNSITTVKQNICVIPDVSRTC